LSGRWALGSFIELMKSKLAVFASGDGSNFQALVEASRSGALAADVVGLIANRGKIGALGRAARLHVPAAIMSPKAFTSRADWDRAVVKQLKDWGVEWIALAGFLALIGPELLRSFPGRIVNSHPSLLPRHGGHGMYGSNVHAAVLAAGDRETGITVHTIDEQYDRGAILSQLKVPVLEGDTLSTLEARVKAAEISFYPKVLNELVTGRLGSDKSK
jgi:phosphoribosylglycinamide formyltransferase-1